MPARPLGLLAVLLVALAAGCGGDDDQPRTAASMPPLDEASFAAVVSAAVEREAEAEAEPAGRGKLTITRDLDRVTLGLADAYTRYRAHPEQRNAIVAELVDEARTGIEAGIPRAELADVRRDLMPLLKPGFELRRLSSDPPRQRFAKGLWIVFGIDRDGEFTLVQPDDLMRWDLTLAELGEIAQANLVRRTEPLLCEEELCGWAGGDGYDATRLTSAKLRADIEEEIGRAAYAVPREDVFVAIPIRFAARIGNKVLEQFTMAERPVSPDVFVERAGRVVPLA
jgi:uncharacterized protein YtpQ (UPF0354 family)